MNNQIWWYATRAAGLMTLTTAAASVLVGLKLWLNPSRAGPGSWTLDLYRILSAVSVLFLTGHLAALWVDSTAEFGWRELVIPGESTWEPRAAALGVVAGWALVSVQLASLVRNQLSPLIWRAIHLVSVLTVATGAYHAWLGGTDMTNSTTWIVAGLGSVLVVALTAVRLRQNDETRPREGGLSEREALLLEMRDRLDQLPAPSSVLPPQITMDSDRELPQRSPVAESTPSLQLDDALRPTPSIATIGTGFGDDPFTATPFSDDPAGLGGWVGMSPNDPFASTSAPSRFGSEAPPRDPISITRESANDTNADIFGPATNEETRVNVTDLPKFLPFDAHTNPFSPADPPSSAISVPVEQPVAVGPPPLPEAALDPVTGEPDESVYTAWLVEWLAYAERYGEESVEDPGRADDAQ